MVEMVARRSRGWIRLASAVHVQADMAKRKKTYAKMRAELESIAASSVAMTHGTASQVSTTAFHLQGDADMHTADKIEARLRLRQDRAVIAVLDSWFEAATSGLASEWEGAGRAPNKKSAAVALDFSNGKRTKQANTVSKAQYIAMSRNMYKAVVEVWDPEDAQAVAEEEWERDVGVGDKLTMSRDKFMNALFEFADLWTLGVSAEEYTNFLQLLFTKVADSEPCRLKPEGEQRHALHRATLYTAPRITQHRATHYTAPQPLPHRGSSSLHTHLPLHPQEPA